MEKGYKSRGLNQLIMPWGGKDESLIEAAKRGDLDEVKRLIENGADVNIKDNDGDTPLHYAASGGHLDVVKFLVENGADVNAKDKYGRTPLDVAKPKVRWVLEDLIKRVGESPVQKPINVTKPITITNEPTQLCQALCRVYSPINAFLALLDSGLTDKDLQDLRKTLIEVRGHVKGIHQHLLEVHDEEGVRIMDVLHDKLERIIELINVAQPDKIDEAELRSMLIEIQAYAEPKIKNLKCECK